MRWLVTALVALAALEVAAAAGQFAKEDIFPSLPIVAVWSDNPRCKADSLQLLKSLNSSAMWAEAMWDASAKGVVGALAGNAFQLGNFDECVAQVRPMRAQYCLATVTVALSPHALRDNATHGTVWDKIARPDGREMLRRDVIHWALCVPASCSHADVEASLMRHLASTGRNNSRASASVRVNAAMCQTGRQEEKLSAGAIAYCVILALIVVLVVGSTVFDFLSFSESDKDTHSSLVGYLLCFSMRKNFPEIALPAESEVNLDCLNGMRVLSMCLIIVDHRIGSSIGGPIQNFDYIEKQYHQFYSLFLYKGEVLVDTFFVISGLLVTYILCLTLDKKKVNPLQAFVLRYIRLTPVYMVVIFFYSTLIYHMGDGPLWNQIVGFERDACVNNWWTNLLYINNYVKDDQMCMVQSWYLPCDTHFFVVALLVVMVLHKRPKTGMCLLGALVFASTLVPILITFVGRKAPLVYFYPDFFLSPRTHPLFRETYTKSHTRAGPYFVGMAAGYFLYRTRAHDKRYKWETTAMMAFAVMLCCVSVFPAILFYDTFWQYDVIQASVYAGVHRIVWALGICCLVVAIVFSKNSLVGAVLAWSPLSALSKLVYSQYLVHVAIQTVHAASMRTPQHFDWLNVFSQTLGDICWSLVFSLMLYLSVEAPVRLIVKRLLTPRARVVPERTS